MPAPKDTRKERLRALIFDSYYDAYKVLFNKPSPASSFLCLSADTSI